MKSQAVNQWQSLSDLSHKNIGHLCQWDASRVISFGCSSRSKSPCFGVKGGKQRGKVLSPQSHSFALGGQLWKTVKSVLSKYPSPTSTATRYI